MHHLDLSKALKQVSAHLQQMSQADASLHCVWQHVDGMILTTLCQADLRIVTSSTLLGTAECHVK